MVGRITENVKHPQRHRHGGAIQRILDVLLKLLLLEEFLESVSPRHNTVAILRRPIRFHRFLDQAGHHQQPAGMTIRIHERFQPLGWILNNIQHVAHVDDVRLALCHFGPMHRIPTFRRVPQRLQSAHITTLSATVVEESRFGFQHPIFQKRLHWLRQIIPGHRGFVPFDERFWFCHHRRRLLTTFQSVPLDD